jgi:hypothetical protein
MNVENQGQSIALVVDENKIKSNLYIYIHNIHVIMYVCVWYSSYLYQITCNSKILFTHAISTFYCVICNVCVQMYKTPYPVSVCLMY